MFVILYLIFLKKGVFFPGRVAKLVGVAPRKPEGCGLDPGQGCTSVQEATDHCFIDV